MEDQLAMERLRQFRAGHPGVMIGRGEFGSWEARIPQQRGERFVYGTTAGDLLDRLDVIADAAA